MIHAWDIGVASPSCHSPSALLSSINRQEAMGCNTQYHASPRPLHKIVHRARNEHDSIVAAGFCGKHSTDHGTGSLVARFATSEIVS